MTAAPTFVAMTYNLWGGHRLAAREPALRALFQVRPPDVLGVQELQPDSARFIDETLHTHDRVHDEHPGWTTRGNIWWNRDRFRLIEHGAEDVGIRHEHSDLFWARLGFTGHEDRPPLLFATAHLTWPGHPQERLDDVNPRVEQARRVVAALNELAGDGPCVFVVDVNDVARPLWVLREGGFTDSFAALGSSSPVTHPVIPQIDPGRGWQAAEPVQKVLDWLFHRGPLTPRTSEVVEFFYEGQAPSDHKPVVATYSLS